MIFSINAARRAIRAAVLGLFAFGSVWAYALELRIGNVQVEDSPVGRGVLKFAEEVKRLSGGKIVVRPMNGGSAGSDTEMRPKVIDGTLEMMAASSTLFLPLSKEFALWDTPFLFARYEEADAVLDGPIGQRALDSLAAKGVVGIAYWENGFRHLTNSARPITRVEDFKDLKLRVQQSDISIATFKSLGVNVKAMPFPEVYGALKDKTMDAQENPLPTILASKFYEVQSFITLTRHTYSPTAVVASKKWWDKLTADERRIIIAAAKEARLSQRQDSRRTAENALNELKAKGMKVGELAAGERSRIENKLEKVNAQIAASVGLPLWIEVTDTLQKLRSK